MGRYAESSLSPEPGTRLLALLGFCSFFFYCVLFVFFAGSTWHTVDTIRDFHAAAAIARGEHFPLASQPWAARYQTPPVYLYLLAFAVKLGADEVALMRIIGMVGLAAVWLLHRAIRPVFGANVANAYLVVAFTVTGALFGHSIGNTLLAMAASGVLLATLLRMAAAPGPGRATLLIVLAALLPQLHLSGLPLALLVLVAAFTRYRRAFLSPMPAVVAILFAVGMAAWLALVGGTAPEAVTAAPDNALSLGAVIGRLLDPSHWYALLTTFVRFVGALTPTAHLPQWQIVALGWLVATFTALTVCCGVAGMVTLLRSRSPPPSPAAGPILAIVTVCAFVVAAAYIKAWGVWYFDTLWPWLAVCVAAGIAHLFGRNRACDQPQLAVILPNRLHSAGAGIVLCMVWGSSVLPAAVLHRALVADGEMVIAARGVFYPPSPGTDGHLVELRADRQLELRDALRDATACDMTAAVGIYELYLRDFTLRDTWKACPTAGPAAQTTNPILVVRSNWPFAETISWTPSFVADLPPLRLLRLPAQRVEVGERSTNQLSSDIALRYTLFRPALLQQRTEIRAQSLADAGSLVRLRIALRCLAPVEPASLFEAQGGVIMRPVLVGAVLGIHYYLLESDLKKSEFVVRSQMGIACDLMAYLVPAP